MDKSTCSVEECVRRAASKGYCASHYTRFKANGNPLRPCEACGRDCPIGFGPKVYCSSECIPKCGVAECIRKTSGRATYCSVHMSSIYKHGKLPEKPWAKDKKCLVCGATEWSGKGRTTCSGRCKTLMSNHGGIPPAKERKCSRCSTVINFAVPVGEGRKRRSDTILCGRCTAARRTRYKVSVTWLADRDGLACGICKEQVDLSLRHPHRQSPSVDHVIPRAHNGSDHPENLQLSHLTCNLTKQARLNYKSY